LHALACDRERIFVLHIVVGVFVGIALLIGAVICIGCIQIIILSEIVRLHHNIFQLNILHPYLLSLYVCI